MTLLIGAPMSAYFLRSTFALCQCRVLSEAGKRTGTFGSTGGGLESPA